MELEPKGKWIVGRIIDIDTSKAGIALAQSQQKGVTYFLLVDKIGPGVTTVKVGDVILYKHMNHVFLRDGTHCAVVYDGAVNGEDNIVATVTGLDPTRITVGGEKRNVDGTDPYAAPSQA
jgi:hypothetical protein